jgi:hypothetical protein
VIAGETRYSARGIFIPLRVHKGSALVVHNGNLLIVRKNVHQRLLINKAVRLLRQRNRCLLLLLLLQLRVVKNAGAGRSQLQNVLERHFSHMPYSICEKTIVAAVRR